MALCEHENKTMICSDTVLAVQSDSANLKSQALPGKPSPHESTESSSTAAILPVPTDILNYVQYKGYAGSGSSTWPSCFGSSRHTSSLIGDVCQTRQAASKFGQPAIGEQLMDGGGFSHSSRGDHRHCPEQSTAAGSDRTQNRTLGLATNRLRVKETKATKKFKVSSHSCSRTDWERITGFFTPICQYL